MYIIMKLCPGLFESPSESQGSQIRVISAAQIARGFYSVVGVDVAD